MYPNQAVQPQVQTVQTVNFDTAKEAPPLSYIKGIQSPEDLVQIPDTKWIIASGMANNSGLHLIDSTTKTATRLIAPKGKAIAEFATSTEQPTADEMQIHGIHIKKMGKNYRLYAVNHNGVGEKSSRETIEIFEINTHGTPTLTWLGNVPMPKDDTGKYLTGNGVAVGADGAIYVTVMMHPEHTLDDMFAGRKTGAIYRYSPQIGHFEKLQGSELNGNNGIELSADGKFIYVAHMRGLSKLINSNPVKAVATTTLNYGVFDNLHWAGDKLITAGSQTETCGDVMTFECLKDFHITTINPDNLAVQPLFKGKYTAEFSGISTVLPVGNTYYLGSFYKDKMAYFEVK
ncbi:SMP-30/gluconolactonase/LRE family protein [Mannheimia varigena]|uniref:SMP-30/gluconolactonase/LRE family protein n=1 Tax=Mannheimia varigena TaxID=85404 RepID=UPI0015B5690F|nr:SMP-30/gluconolactonase/LRE family protein [Mannheimia varigena]QLD32520.1 SMP-30/gluconolactonase/LRE family protein [Mannheimia varigena]